MEPGVFFHLPILRSEIKGIGLNGIATFHDEIREAKEGATRRVHQVHRFLLFRLWFPDSEWRASPPVQNRETGAPHHDVTFRPCRATARNLPRRKTPAGQVDRKGAPYGDCALQRVARTRGGRGCRETWPGPSGIDGGK